MKHHLSTLFIAMTIATPTLSMASMPDEKVVGMSLSELRVALDSGALKSADLVSAYLRRIEKLDRGPEGIRAVLAVSGTAMDHARAWDADQAKNGANRRNAPLAGIPFLAKDNFDAVGLPNTGGSLALANSIPEKNSFVVQRLIDQGAILIGKTNLSEMAASYGWYGYSSVGGQTLNPFNPLRTADGSSSGSAAAVAAKFAPFALGTDTTASIRAPASVTGTVGMRGTMGLVSRAGIIPMSLTADVAGAITRSVEDQAIVLDAIQAIDAKDGATKWVSRPTKPFVTGLSDSTLAGKTIAVVDNFDGANPEVDAVKRNSVASLAKAGAKIVHIRLPKAYETLQPSVLGPIGLAEFRPQFDAYLATLPAGQPRNLQEFMARLEAETNKGAHTINPGRYKGFVENLETLTTDSPEYIQLLSSVIPSLKRELEELMVAGQYDALFFPTIGCTAPVVPGKSDPNFVCKAYAYAAAKISSTTGFPEITVNGGVASGRDPVGVSFLGKPGDDGKVLEVASAFEREHRRSAGRMGE